MKRLSYIITIVITLACSCSHVDEDERLIYVKPAQVSRCILIEDFTGQRCVNCPVATAEILKLQQHYGSDTIIAVGIHSGPLGFAGNEKNIGLMTTVGNEYYNYWKVDYQPAGLIDRNGGILNYTDWQAKVYEELQKPAPLSLKVENQYEPTSHNIDINLTALGTDGDTKGKLQLWVTEDEITAMQLRYNSITDAASGQITDREYIHNHVLRDAVNGIWGEDFTVREGEQKTLYFTYTLKSEWVAENMHVIAFVYNDNGVQQVTKAKVVGNKQPK